MDDHSQQLDEVRGDVGGLIANDAVQDETLADHQEQLDDHSQQLDEVRGDVGGLIANDAVQDETLADHQEQLDDHSQQLDEVRGDVGSLIANDAVQDADIDKLQANDATQDTAINDLKGVTGAANKGELDAAYSGTNYIEGSASMVEADQRLVPALTVLKTVWTVWKTALIK